MIATIIVSNFLSFFVGRRGFAGIVVHLIVAIKLRRKFLLSCPNCGVLSCGATDCLSVSDGVELSLDNSAAVCMKQFMGNEGTVYRGGRLSKSIDRVAIVVVLMLKDFICVEGFRDFFAVFLTIHNILA